MIKSFSFPDRHK